MLKGTFHGFLVFVGWDRRTDGIHEGGDVHSQS
jgi:hypothetical protein